MPCFAASTPFEVLEDMIFYSVEMQRFHSVLQTARKKSVAATNNVDVTPETRAAEDILVLADVVSTLRSEGFKVTEPPSSDNATDLLGIFLCCTQCTSEIGTE